MEEALVAPDETSTAEDPLEPGRNYRFFQSRLADGLVLEVACEVLADQIRFLREDGSGKPYRHPGQDQEKRGDYFKLP